MRSLRKMMAPIDTNVKKEKVHNGKTLKLINMNIELTGKMEKIDSIIVGTKNIKILKFMIVKQDILDQKIPLQEGYIGKVI
jgi:hypothetical protein